MKDSNKIIFVHVPRTGGTSIGTALGYYKNEHRHFFARKHMAIRDDWKDCFKFSFVRNPWDRVVSLYMYQTKGTQNFKNWLMDIVKRDGSPLKRKRSWKLTPKMSSTGGSSFPWKTQSDWLIDNKGDLCMDFIGKFENIKEDFAKLSELIGKKMKLPHLNGTAHQDYQYYYDTETKKIVADWCRKDIEFFGYEFGPRITIL